jgi:hypothetical protein
MRLTRVMHEETNLLNCISEILASQCEILQSTGEVAVLSDIRYGSVVHSRKLGMSVHRGRCRVALSHAGTQ